jgi:predicted transcriptional regulator
MQKYKIIDFKNKDFIYVSTKTSLNEIAQILLKEKLRYIPIIDKSENEYKMYGLLDFMDITTHILDIAPSTKELKNDEKKATEEAKEILKSTIAYDVINKSGVNLNLN